MTRRTHLICTVIALPFLCVGTASANRQDELAGRASWQAPPPKDVSKRVAEWIESLPDPVTGDIQVAIDQLWRDAEHKSPRDTMTSLVKTIGLVDARVAQLVELCERPRPAIELLPEVVVLEDASMPSWAHDNLRLHYGIWLANQQLYDEAHANLESLDWSDVADPAALLFYQSLVQHRRLDKAACLATIAVLLENESQLPKRYAAVAKLMLADLKPLQTDSLDEISRMMDNVKVRLGHGRAGKRVRKEEADVIAKLDKLIEQLEEQASASASAGGASDAPSQPMQDSMPGQNSGPGNVDPKKLGTDTDWGNLPPKQREEALQQLSKDLPSHYRTVIEEYFRKLATERD